MQALYRLVARVMNTDLPVLITGELGTGKSLIARAIHDFSDRRSLPFVRGASRPIWPGWTGFPTLLAKARGGSLLIDEVADFDDDGQARLVRMLDIADDHAPRIMATIAGRSGAAGRGGAVPQGPVLPAGRGDARRAVAARTGRGYPPSGRTFPDPGRARDWHGAAPSERRGARCPARLSLARQCAPVGKRAEAAAGHVVRTRDRPGRGGGRFGRAASRRNRHARG